MTATATATTIAVAMKEAATAIAKTTSTTIWTLMRRLQSSITAVQHQQWLQQQAGPRSTLVYCCPGGEPKDSALASTTIRLGKATSFREVSANAARFFGMVPERCLLEDDNGTLWPLDVMVSREVARYRGEQVLRVVQRYRDERAQ